MLTSAQKVTLQTNILSLTGVGEPNEPVVGPYVVGNLTGTVDYYNALAVPDFWVWRTAVSRAEIYNDVSPDATTWSWTTYRNQSATEQNAWVQMFMGDQANFAKENLRTGIGAIFTGSAQANAQRDHCLSAGRRKATRLEKLFATGTGSTASPAVMGVEGDLTTTDLVGL